MTDTQDSEHPPRNPSAPQPAGQQCEGLEDALLDEHQRRQALLAMLEDLQDEQHQIERARKEWSNAFDAVREPIFIHDQDFRIVRANLAYARAAGMDIKELIGKQYWEAFPKRTAPLPSCARHLEKAEEEEEEEVRLESGAIYVSRAYAIRDEQGRYLHSIHILEDVTTQRRTTEDLRESEQRHRQLFEASRDALMTLAPPSWKFTSANRATLEMFGAATADEFTALGPWQVSPERQPDGQPSSEKSKAMIARAMQEGANFFEWEHRRLNGECFAADVLLTRMELGSEIFLQATVRDISERKQREAELRRINRALMTLSAGNQGLIRATEEASLLQEMCRVIVEVGGYRDASVFTPQHDAAKSIAMAAHSGPNLEYLKLLGFTWADDEKGQGTLGRAIRSGMTQVSQDTLADSKLAAWHAAVEKLGCRAAISLPLKNSDGTVFAALSICAAETQAFDETEINLLQELADDLAFGILTLRTRQERDHYQQEHLKSAERLKETLTDTIRAIALTVEKRDPYTAGHQSRVANLAAAIAGEFGLDAERIEGLRLGAMIHDIGKIYVPAEILNRPGRLAAPEFEMIKTHPEVGYDIIKDVKFPWPVADMILQHHERMDGSGYPKGLKGEDIILEARILGVADVVEAITAHRPYRPALGIDKALAEIEAKRGQGYDADVVDACLRLFRENGYTLEEAP